MTMVSCVLCVSVLGGATHRMAVHGDQQVEPDSALATVRADADRYQRFEVFLMFCRVELSSAR